MVSIVKRYFWVLHLACVAALAFVGADIVSGILREKLRLAPQVTERRPNSATKKQERRSSSHYAVIHQRDLFHSAREKAGAKKSDSKPKKAVIKQEALEKTPLEVRLRGTIHREKGNSLAIIEDVKARKQDLYHVGDVILGEAKLIAVLRNKVYLERNGKKELLEIYGEKETKAGERTSSTRPQGGPTPEGSGIKRLSANRYRIPQEDLTNAFTNMSQLLTQVRVVPNLNNGQPDGFKLLSIKRGSLIHRAGLRDGDIVKRVNGIEIDSPEKAFEVYEQIKSEPVIAVEIVRRGRTQTLNYEVR